MTETAAPPKPSGTPDAGTPVVCTTPKCPTPPSVKIRNEACKADGCRLIPKGKTHKYCAVGTPGGGSYQWKVAGKVSILGTATSKIIEIKGNNISAALDDSELTVEYTLTGQKATDTIKLTVFEITKIAVKLRGTPCHRDKTRANTMPAKSSNKDSKAFDAKAITVVRECGDLNLKATVLPSGVPLNWEVERASDDKGLVGLPTHAADGDNTKRKLTADATGSFHVNAFVDCNGNGKRDPNEVGIILNVNMIDIEVPIGAWNNKIFRNNAGFSSARSTATRLIVDSGASQGVFSIVPSINGNYNDTEFANHAIAMKVTVKLTGGGPDQQRGLEKVGLGYIQQTTAESVQGTYADARTLREVIVVNAATPSPITAGAPAMLAFPVRDTRGASVKGTWPFIISSSDRARKDDPSGGQWRIVRFIDPPAIVLNLTHPVTNSALAIISGSNNFKVFLSAYSSDFNENYTIIASAVWSVNYGSYTAAGGWTNVGATINSARTMNVLVPPKRGQATDVERCTPNFVDNLKMDAR